MEPPIAEFKTIEFSKASRVSILDGVRSSFTISTMRSPVRYDISPLSLRGAGIAAQPGRDIPSPSAREFIVVAVPMVLQCPGEVVASTTI